MSKKIKKTVFNNKWLEEDDFKSWIVKDTKDTSKARCKVCKKDIDLSNMGRQALVSHASGSKHKELNVKIQTFFQPKSKTVRQKESTSGNSEASGSNLSELKLFDQSKTRLDFFYFHVLGAEVKKAGKSFAHVLKLILTLSHGQAAVERGFSLGKSSLQTNISEESIIAKKVVRDYLLANQVKVSTFSAPSKLILSCKSARARYHTSLEEKAKNSAKDARKVKRELLKEEINELVVRELKLKKTCESLESDFVNLVSEAEKRPDEMVSLITKANALKRRQTELNMDLEELQSQIEGKRQKLT